MKETSVNSLNNDTEQQTTDSEFSEAESETVIAESGVNEESSSDDTESESSIGSDSGSSVTEYNTNVYYDDSEIIDTINTHAEIIHNDLVTINTSLQGLISLFIILFIIIICSYVYRFFSMFLNGTKRPF